MSKNQVQICTLKLTSREAIVKTIVINYNSHPLGDLPSMAKASDYYEIAGWISKTSILKICLQGLGFSPLGSTQPCH